MMTSGIDARFVNQFECASQNLCTLRAVITLFCRELLCNAVAVEYLVEYTNRSIGDLV